MTGNWIKTKSSINFSKFWQKVYKNFNNISHETYQTVILNENFIRYQFFHNITIWHMNIVGEKKINTITSSKWLSILIFQYSLQYSFQYSLPWFKSNHVMLWNITQQKNHTNKISRRISSMEIDNIFILIIHIKNLSPSHSEPSHTSKMGFFVKFFLRL